MVHGTQTDVGEGHDLSEGRGMGGALDGVWRESEVDDPTLTNKLLNLCILLQCLSSDVIRCGHDL